MIAVHENLDPRNGDVVATVDIAVPPERVFRALTDPEELSAWWVAQGTGTSLAPGSHDWRVDARPNGRWSVSTTDAIGRDATVRGEYRVVDPPRLLEFSWEASWDGFALTTVRCELEPISVDGVPGTRLRVTHTAPRGVMAYGGIARSRFSWRAGLASLAVHVLGHRAMGSTIHRPFEIGDPLPHRSQVIGRLQATEIVG
jgi:uncharacterized protein YndB with AHSA1/START domain